MDDSSVQVPVIWSPKRFSVVSHQCYTVTDFGGFIGIPSFRRTMRTPITCVSTSTSAIDLVQQYYSRIRQYNDAHPDEEPYTFSTMLVIQDMADNTWLRSVQCRVAPDGSLMRECRPIKVFRLPDMEKRYQYRTVRSRYDFFDDGIEKRYPVKSIDEFLYDQV